MPTEYWWNYITTFLERNYEIQELILITPISDLDNVIPVTVDLQGLGSGPGNRWSATLSRVNTDSRGARRVAPLRPGQCGQIGAGSPSDEEPSGRAVRTLSRGDQSQRPSAKLQPQVLCRGIHQPCARAEAGYVARSKFGDGVGDRMRPPIRRHRNAERLGIRRENAEVEAAQTPRACRVIGPPHYCANRENSHASAVMPMKADAVY